MLLTAAGAQLYAQARTTLSAAEALKQQAQQLSNAVVGELRVGIHTDFDYLQIGELFRLSTERHPQLVPHFLISSSSTVVQELRQNKLDAGFMFGPCSAADVVALHLQEVPMRLIGPAAWREQIVDAPLPALAQLPWVYTSRSCVFYQLFETLFAELEQAPKEIVWCDVEDAVRTLIRSEAGLSIVKLSDAELAEAQGYGCTWQGELPALELNFVTLKQREHEPAIAALRACIEALWQPQQAALKRSS